MTYNGCARLKIRINKYLLSTQISEGALVFTLKCRGHCHQKAPLLGIAKLKNSLVGAECGHSMGRL